MNKCTALAPHAPLYPTSSNTPPRYPPPFSASRRKGLLSAYNCWLIVKGEILQWPASWRSRVFSLLGSLCNCFRPCDYGSRSVSNNEMISAFWRSTLRRVWNLTFCNIAMNLLLCRIPALISVSCSLSMTNIQIVLLQVDNLSNNTIKSKSCKARGFESLSSWRTVEKCAFLAHKGLFLFVGSSTCCWSLTNLMLNRHEHVVERPITCCVFAMHALMEDGSCRYGFLTSIITHF